MINTSGEFVTLTLFCASGTAGGFKSDVKIMKMISSTSNTSVNGVMLIVGMTSSSGAAPTTDIVFAFRLCAYVLLRHEADRIISGRAGRVSDLSARVVAGGALCHKRYVGRVSLILMCAVKGDRVGHDRVQVLHADEFAIDVDAVLRSDVNLDLVLQNILGNILRCDIFLRQLLLEAGRCCKCC